MGKMPVIIRHVYTRNWLTAPIVSISIGLDFVRLIFFFSIFFSFVEIFLARFLAGQKDAKLSITAKRKSHLIHCDLGDRWAQDWCHPWEYSVRARSLVPNRKFDRKVQYSRILLFGTDEAEAYSAAGMELRSAKAIYFGGFIACVLWCARAEGDLTANSFCEWRTVDAL